MAQLTVSAGGMSIGIPGQIADSGPHDIVSGFNEGTAQIPFGYGLRQGSVADFYQLATGFSNVSQIVGLSVYDYCHVRSSNVDPLGKSSGDLGASGLVQNAGLQVARKGRYLVPVEASPAVNDRAWCRGVATGSLTAGVWRGAAAGSAPLGASYHVDCTSQGVFRSVALTAADGTTLVAVLEVDFTNKP